MLYNVSSQYICSGEPYDMIATVKAYNQASAQSQLNWLSQNKHCMCQDCIAEYEISYLTHIVLPSVMPIYNMCVKR